MDAKAYKAGNDAENLRVWSSILRGGTSVNSLYGIYL